MAPFSVRNAFDVGQNEIVPRRIPIPAVVRPKRILPRPEITTTTTTTAMKTESARNTFDPSSVGGPRTTDDNGPAGRVRWRGHDDALPAQRSPRETRQPSVTQCDQKLRKYRWRPRHSETDEVGRPKSVGRMEIDEQKYHWTTSDRAWSDGADRRHSGWFRRARKSNAYGHRNYARIAFRYRIYVPEVREIRDGIYVQARETNIQPVNYFLLSFNAKRISYINM